MFRRPNEINPNDLLNLNQTCWFCVVSYFSSEKRCVLHLLFWLIWRCKNPVILSFVYCINHITKFRRNVRYFWHNGWKHIADNFDNILKTWKLWLSPIKQQTETFYLILNIFFSHLFLDLEWIGSTTNCISKFVYQ